MPSAFRSLNVVNAYQPMRDELGMIKIFCGMIDAADFSSSLNFEIEVFICL